MKKYFVFLCALFCAVAINAKTIYLNAGGSTYWDQADAVFFVHAWGAGNEDVQMTSAAAGIYSATIQDGQTSIIFLREKPGSTAVSWVYTSDGGNLWNKTGNLTIPADKNCYTITGWGDNSGTWSSYTAGEGGGEQGGGTQGGGTEEGEGESVTGSDFGILVYSASGTHSYVAGVKNEEQADWLEYAVLGQTFAAGAQFQIYDNTNKAGWVDPLDAAGTPNVTLGQYWYQVAVAGTYDIYIKMLGPGNNQIYVACVSEQQGGGEQGGGEQGGGTQGGGTGSATDYYLCGWINGADYGKGETDWQTLGDYKFVGGKLDVNFTQDSWVYFKTGDLSKWFMLDSANEAQRTAASATFFDTNTDQKYCRDWKVPAGAKTITLVENADGSVTLSYGSTQGGGEQGGGEQGGGTQGGGGSTSDDPEWYLFGYINNKDYSAYDYPFVCGRVALPALTADAYIFVHHWESGHEYFTNGWVDAPTVTMVDGQTITSGHNRLKVPAGTQYVYMKDNGDGTLTVSINPIAGGQNGECGSEGEGGEQGGGEQGGGTVTPDPEETGLVVKAHFDETTIWMATDGVYMWCWNRPAANGHFVPMTKNSKGWYVASFEGATPDSVIFVNRGAWEEGLLAGYQSKTIAFPSVSTCYQISWDGQGVEGDNGQSWMPTATPADCSLEWKEESSDDYKPGDYASSVPSQCGDVMLQGFYWDSMGDNGFGDTRWSSLLAQAAEIGSYFDLVWLAPSAKSSGGLGYHPSQYCNQSSGMGNKNELKSLISALHASNTKVIADIVINHAGNKSGWCDFNAEDFGAFGTFHPDYSWITRDDEVWSSGQAACSTPGANAGYDDGQGDPKNYGAARDWDHTQAQVRDMFKAYLKWMKSEMKYDGWRYDYCKGFHESHINDYNAAAKNYFSVMEWWDGNPNTLNAAIGRAGNNTLTFDFATKYTAFDQGIAAGNYNKCKGAGLLGMGKSKYAVTFIDSHDTFQRSESSDVCGSNNGGSINNKSVILQCNAYILSMPGVPCVFYPHWVRYKEDLKKMIYARKMAGVHSESAVSDVADGGGYEATITGKTGSIKLYLGNKAASANPAGYTLAIKDAGVAVFYTTTLSTKPVLNVTPVSGTYKTAQTVQMSAMATGTCNIYYTTNGSEPSASSTKYTAPISVSTNTTIKAIAICGSEKSDVVTREYIFEDEEEDPVDPIPAEGITVRFHVLAECNWYTDDYGVAYYVWRTETDGKQYQATKTGAWWTYTFPEGFETPFNIIAHVAADSELGWTGINADQTDDIEGVTGTICFEVSSKGEGIEGDGDSWLRKATAIDCDTKPIDPSEGMEQVEVVLDMNAPMYNILGQRVDASYIGIVLQGGRKFLIVR